MKRTRLKSLVISVALLMAGSSAFARTRPHYGGVLKVETRAPAVESSQLRALATESLTAVDDSGRVLPWLADRWESRNDGREWAFFLHPRISMHDGAALTGGIVADILNSVPGSKPWRSVASTDSTVTLECGAAIPNLPVLLASKDFAIARRAPDGAWIGTGPYRVSSVSGSNATLDANDNYWRGRGYVDRVEIAGGRAVRSQWLDLGVNRADVAEVPGEFLRRSQQDHLRTVGMATGELVLIVASQEAGDINLRHAVSASIDRTALSNVVFQRQGEPASTLLPDSTTGYGTLFPTASDSSIARQLNTRAGYAPALTISYDPSDPALQLAAERIALNARDAGITLRAVPRNAAMQGSWRLLRVPIANTDPVAALEELSRHLLGKTLAPVSNIEALYMREREIVDAYQIIPLLHLPAAAAFGERVRDLPDAWEAEDLSNVWIEERR
jgi:peptide/nickel transport system substrate-binding protein